MNIGCGGGGGGEGDGFGDCAFDTFDKRRTDFEAFDEAFVALDDFDDAFDDALDDFDDAFDDALDDAFDDAFDEAFDETMLVSDEESPKTSSMRCTGGFRRMSTLCGFATLWNNSYWLVVIPYALQTYSTHHATNAPS